MPYGIRTIFEESVSQITASPSVALGTRRIEGSKEYIYAYNAATTAVVGKGMIASAMSGFSATVSSAVGDPLFGVVQNTDLKSGYYGWLQNRGLAKVYAGSSITLGVAVVLGANGGFQPVATALAGGTHATCGVPLEDVVTGASGSAFVKAAI